MANLKSSKKDSLRSAQNRLINREAKQKIKNLKKTVYNLTLNKNFNEAQEKFKEFVSTMAKATQKNIYKKNKLARTIGRFHLKLKTMGLFQ